MHENRKPIDLHKLQAAAESGRCFICEYLSGNPEFSHQKLVETERAIAFLDRYPTLFGRVIVAPKEHVEQVTGDFSLSHYLELQSFVYKVSEAIRSVLKPERIYILSLGSQAANAHVHWHIAPLPHGLDLNQQQYFALMHEHGVVGADEVEIERFVRQVRQVMGVE